MGLNAEDQLVGACLDDVAEVSVAFHGREQIEWRAFELNGDFRELPRESFACAEEERHAGPAPVIDEDLHGDIGFAAGRWTDSVFFPVGECWLAINKSG